MPVVMDYKKNHNSLQRILLRGRIFLLPLNPGWSCDFLWPVEYGRSHGGWFQTQDSGDLSCFPQLLGTLWAPCEKSSSLGGEGETGGAGRGLLADVILSQAAPAPDTGTCRS